jgi:hypothetical protein
MKSKHCSWCDSQFSTTISYQIYCSAECRTEATKEKIAERYERVRRARMLQKDRRCKTCGGRLSSYNDDNLCHGCVVDKDDVSKALRDIKRSANGKELS